MLQTRNAKRPAQAAVRVAVDMVERGPADRERGARDDRRRRARRAAAPDLRPGVPSTSRSRRGVRGVARRRQGRDRLHRRRGRRSARATGDAVILVRPFTEADDVAGLPRRARDPHLARAARPRTRRWSRAAWAGRACAARPSSQIDLDGAARCASDGRVLRAGDLIAIDGTHRRRSRPTTCRWSTPQIGEHFETVLAWADELRAPGRARERGHARRRAPGARASAPRASGCAAPSTCSCRPTASRRCGDDHGRRRRPSGARRSTSCCPLQQADFEGIFDAMEGLPVTIRLLDPPLHEFLPSTRSCTCDRAERARARARSRARGARARARAGAGAGGDEPDARHARLPPRDPRSPRSTRCRCGRSSAPRWRCASAPASAPTVEIMIPLVDYERELELMRELVDADGRASDRRARRGASDTRSGR